MTREEAYKGGQKLQTYEMQEMNFYSKWRRASGESVRIDVFCSCKFSGMEGYCYGKILFFINVKDVLYIVLRLYEITQHNSVLKSDIITRSDRKSVV